MQTTNIVTPENFEGVIYYLKNNQIMSSQGKSVVFEPNKPVRDFFVASGSFFYLASVNSNQYFVRNNEVLLSTGSIVNGINARSFLDLRGNNRSEVTFSVYDDEPSPTVHLIKYSEKTCSVSDVTKRNVNFYPQVAPGAWALDLLGFHKESDTGSKYMKAVGCVTTAYAMLFDYFGINRLYNKITGFDTSPSVSTANTLFNSQTDPGTLNKLFRGTTDLQGPSKAIQTYNSNNDIVAAVAAHAGRATFQLKCYNDAQANGQFLTNNLVAMNDCIERSKSIISLKGSPRWGHAINNQSKQKRMAEIEKEICAGNPVLLRVERDVASNTVGPPRYDGHTILATGTSFTASGDLTFIVHNPGTRNGKDLFLEDVFSGKFMSHTYPFLVGYDLFKPQADPSMITIYSTANLQFFLVDNLGRRAGFNPATGLYYDEIPGAVYSYEGIDPVLEEGEFDTGEKNLGSYRLFLSEGVQSGNYQISTFGFETGPGSISIYKTDLDGFNTDTEEYNFNVSSGSSETINFKHTIAPLVVNSSSLFIYHSRIEANTAKIYGELVLFDGRKVNCTDIFRFNIGAPTDINYEIPISSFSKKILNNNTFYEYDTAAFKVTISEKGHFWFDIKNLDLTSINIANKGRVSVSVSDQIGSANIVFKCNSNVCYGE